MDIVLRVGQKYGVDEALSIYTSKIYFNYWVGLKYRYDNQDSCKHTMSPDQTYRLLKEYRRAVLVIGNNKDDFNKEGHYKAIALVNGPCALCKGEKTARPALESLGIDILATVRKFKKNVKQPAIGEYPQYAILLVG